VKLTDEFLSKQQLPFTAYELECVNTNDRLTDIRVKLIIIARYGILPGCSSPSISAKDSNGRTFHGSAANYFPTEADAVEDALAQLHKAAAENTIAIHELQRAGRDVEAVIRKLKEELL